MNIDAALSLVLRTIFATLLGAAIWYGVITAVSGWLGRVYGAVFFLSAVFLTLSSLLVFGLLLWRRGAFNMSKASTAEVQTS